MAQEKTSKSNVLRVVEPKIRDPAARAAAVRKAAMRIRTTVTIDPKGRPSEPHSR